MAYVLGDTIAAADFNSFRTSVINVYGVGTGDSGYGQTGITDPGAVSAGGNIGSAEWTALRNMMARCLTHQSGSVGLLPPVSEFAVGQLIEAHESSAPTSDPYDMDSLVAQLTTNRLLANANTLASGVHTNSVAAAWNNVIDATVRATFASGDAARYFFNAAGEIRLTFSHPNTGTSPTQDADWVDVFNNKIGTLTLSANAFARSGTGGTVSSIGYYGLTTTYQTVFDGTNIGGGAYAANDVLVQARTNGTQGANGDTGSYIEFFIRFDDQATGGLDSVAAGTGLTADVLYANDVANVQVTQPTWSTINGL